MSNSSTATPTTRFGDLPHSTRHAIRDIADAHGADCEGYPDGGVTLLMPTAEGGKGLSAPGSALMSVMQSLGFVVTGAWSDYQGIHRHFTATRDPLPNCSVNSQ